jgi:hypothetical protein
MPLAVFPLVIFAIGFHFLPGPGWTVILLFYASCSCWDAIGSLLQAQLFSIEMGSHEPFCLGWPGIIILLISASSVAGMVTGTCLENDFLKTLRITTSLCFQRDLLKCLDP